MDRIRNSKRLRRVEGELRVAPGHLSESSPHSTLDASSNSLPKRTTNELHISNSPSLKSNESFVKKERKSLQERLDERMKGNKAATLPPSSGHKSESTLRKSRKSTSVTSPTRETEEDDMSLWSSSQSTENDEVLKFAHLMDDVENDETLTATQKQKSMAKLLDMAKKEERLEEERDNLNSGISTTASVKSHESIGATASVKSHESIGATASVKSHESIDATTKSEPLKMAKLTEGTMESGSSSTYDSYPYTYTTGSTLPPPQEKGAIRFHLPGRIQHKTTIKVAHFPTDEKPVVVNIEQPDEKEEEEECEIPCFANNSNFMCPPAPACPPLPQYSGYNPYAAYSYGYGSYPSNGYGYGYGYPYS